MKQSQHRNPSQPPLNRGEAKAEEPTPTPLAPLDRGGQKASRLAPSPVKGRAGEGFGRAGEGFSAAGEGLGFDSGILPYNTNLTVLARENRKNPTAAERKIWNEVLRMKQFAGYKFLRQKPIDKYIVDFYCSELRLAIEIDGDSHAENVEYDVERTKILNALGLTVIRYTNDEVLNNIEGVFADLVRRIEEQA